MRYCNSALELYITGVWKRMAHADASADVLVTRLVMPECGTDDPDRCREGGPGHHKNGLEL